MTTAELPQCQSCGHSITAHLYQNRYCWNCYWYRVTTAWLSLPLYPLVFHPNDATQRCSACELLFPENYMFWDRNGYDKCVVCRRFELLNRTEAYPGVQARYGIEGGRTVCVACEAEEDEEDFVLENGMREYLDRRSMFCGDCRAKGLEAKMEQQGLVNTNE